MKKNCLLYIFLFSFTFLVGNSFSQSVKMNEIFSRGTAANPDWIEIYNNSSSSVDISNFKIYDNAGYSGTKPKKAFPSGTILPAYGFYVVITDTADFPGDLSAFGLSNSGEMVWLENELGTVIDSVDFPALTATQTYGRAPDGGNWKILNTITKGKSNVIFTSLILPQYMQGLNGTNNNRVPYAYRLKFENLLPAATYRYLNQVIISTDGPTSGGAGNIIFVNSDGTFLRTTSTSFTTPGQYGEFTTDAEGSYSGWFITEPTGNATRFIPGKYLYLRVRLNDGASGTTPLYYLTTADSIKVINFYNTASDTAGTAIWGSSSAESKDFVFMYDNEAGTGRPIAGTVIENDGVDLASVSSIAAFYRDSVDAKIGRWGTIIPNNLPDGIRRIERRLFADGTLHPVVATDADGIWPSGANTVNPTGGLLPVVILNSDAPIPVELVSFSAIKVENGVKLSWQTATELNNLGFEIQRISAAQEWQKVEFVKGQGTSTSINEYSHTDKNVSSGKYSYRLKQIDFNGDYNYSSIVNIDLTQPVQFKLEQNYPNPFNPTTVISYQLPKNSFVTLKVYNLLGKEIAALINEYQNAGSYSVPLSVDKFNLSSGTYLYELRAGEFVNIKKMLYLK